LYAHCPAPRIGAEVTKPSRNDLFPTLPFPLSTNMSQVCFSISVKIYKVKNKKKISYYNSQMKNYSYSKSNSFCGVQYLFSWKKITIELKDYSITLVMSVKF